MKRIKIFESFNIDQIIKKINAECEVDKYQHPQIRTKDKSFNKEFITYLWSIAEIKRIDALGGKESKSGFRRYNISHLVNFQDIIHMAPTGIASGIKIVKYPIGRIMDYEMWEGGYIEGFIRMDSDDPRFGEYFIWTYMEMDKLSDIIEKFQDKLNFNI
jgi:hypothetical protein